jgi:hypothetical protein
LFALLSKHQEMQINLVLALTQGLENKVTSAYLSLQALLEDCLNSR